MMEWDVVSVWEWNFYIWPKTVLSGHMVTQACSLKFTDRPIVKTNKKPIVPEWGLLTGDWN